MLNHIRSNKSTKWMNLPISQLKISPFSSNDPLYPLARTLETQMDSFDPWFLKATKVSWSWSIMTS